MKIVIPYRHAGGPELKYALRGIEMYMPGHEIIIVGQVPDWTQGVTFIPFTDNERASRKASNIFSKIMFTGEDEMLFFNDDHFLLQPFHENTYHYSGTISQALNGCGSSYKRTLQNTLDRFGNIKNFDTHCPIYYKREILEQINLDWSKPGGYCIKSIYCHLAAIEGSFYPDLKIRETLPAAHVRQLLADREYFSTANRAMDWSMINVMDELYPLKSKYERN